MPTATSKYAKLAELRAARSALARARETPRPQKKTVRFDLDEAQCAGLKAARRTPDSKGKQDVVLRVFECGHVYENLSRVSRDIRGQKEMERGLCGECWRFIASDGRRGHRTRLEDYTRYKMLRDRYKVWVLRPVVTRSWKRRA
ncbi:hypothetical protein F4861DRAFT_17625 [Xylaria intraflava]|nr:hypothetical protein F4861DRAFT_17625 [Xylaria intraflava]